MTRKNQVIREFKRFFFLFIGSILAAVALEIFLVPNNIIDVMFFNIFILSSAGLVFGWDRAMYSLIAYFIAFKVIDVTIEGLDEAKAAIIISEKGEDIADAITVRLGRGVTFLEGRGGFSFRCNGRKA